MHNMPELMCRLMKARSVTFNLCYITAGKHDNEPIFFLFNDTPVCSQNSQKYLIYITSEVLWWNRQWELRHYWMFKLMVCWNWWWKIVHVPQSPFEHEFFLWIYYSCLQHIRLLQFHLYHILHILQTWYHWSPSCLPYPAPQKVPHLY